MTSTDSKTEMHLFRLWFVEESEIHPGGIIGGCAGASARAQSSVDLLRPRRSIDFTWNCDIIYFHSYSRKLPYMECVGLAE